jgi:hypothetical protein
MTTIRVYQDPTLRFAWYRDRDEDIVDCAAVMIRSTFALFDDLVRVFEAKLDIHHEGGILSRVLRASLAAGFDPQIGPWPAEVDEIRGQLLSPSEISDWAAAAAQAVREPIDDLIVRTGGVAVPALNAEHGDTGVDLVAGGETYHHRFLRDDHAGWLVGPIDHMRAPAPVEVEVKVVWNRWYLSFSVFWSAWQSETGDPHSRIIALVDAVERAAWIRQDHEP